MRNEYTVDLTVLREWHKDQLYKGANLVLFILWCVTLIACIPLGIINAFRGVHIYTFFWFWTSVFCIYKAFFYNKIKFKQWYKRLVLAYGKESWIRTIRFEDNGIVVEEEKNKSHFYYADIIEIEERNERIYIKFKSRMYVVLYASKFVDCTWEECKSVILENNPDVKLK